MLKLLSLTALASAVVLATAASVTPASAFAMRGGGGHPGIGGGRYHFSQRFNGQHHYPRRLSRIVPVYPPHPPHPHHWHWHHWRHGSYGWGVPVAVGVGVAA